MPRNPDVQDLVRERLDRQLEGACSAYRAGGFTRPRGGWIRGLRDALGMNGRQLAERMRIARPNLSRLEEAERRGTATLQSMERAAEALGCVFVYAILPKLPDETLGGLVQQRAEALAATIVERVGTTMALEAQGVEEAAFKRREIQRTASTLVRTARKLWDS